MAFTAKDGSRHTNHESMKRANARNMAQQPKQAERESEDEFDAAEPENDGSALAAQHGPAVQIDIQHDHRAGRHTVHAMHENGHEHETEHATADDAHKFAAEVAGAGGEVPEEDEEDEEDEEGY